MGEEGGGGGEDFGGVEGEGGTGFGEDGDEVEVYVGASLLCLSVLVRP